jgi:hypothetical protein
LGCSSSTGPSYLNEDTDEAIRDICKKEYNFDVVTNLSGNTLWVYIPLEDIIKQAKKPVKSFERFVIEQNNNAFEGGVLKTEYLIKPIPEKEKWQQVEYDKDASKKISGVYRVILRVLFSSQQPKKGAVQFIVIVTADIKNGFIMKEVFYYLDFKKMAYNFISYTEFQHRALEDVQVAPEFIGDKEGKNLKFKEVTFEEFIAGQIQNRIQLKFNKPEVPKNADIDKEVLKAVISTFRIYDFRDFTNVEVYNAATKNRVILNRTAVLMGSAD